MDVETSSAHAPTETPVFEWSALEYEYRRKSSDWYWAIGIITISLAIAAFILDGFFFAALIAVGGFVLLLYGAKPPSTLTCRITTRGVQVDRNLYLFSTLDSFGIDEIAEPKLVMKSKSTFAPFIILPLGDASIEDIRNILTPHLKEEDHREPFAQKLMERLGF
jgi:hypothetical protein